MTDKLDLYTTNEEADLTIANIAIVMTELQAWCVEIVRDHYAFRHIYLAIDEVALASGNHVGASTDDEVRATSIRTQLVTMIKAEEPMSALVFDTTNAEREFRRRDGGNVRLADLVHATVSDITMCLLRVCDNLNSLHWDCKLERQVATATGLAGIPLEKYERAIVRTQMAIKRKAECMRFWNRMKMQLRSW